LALGTLALRGLVGLDPNMDGLRFALYPEQFDFLVNKPSKMLNRVEKRFKL
jgi:hypothetical protein